MPKCPSPIRITIRVGRSAGEGVEIIGGEERSSLCPSIQFIHFIYHRYCVNAFKRPYAIKRQANTLRRANLRGVFYFKTDLRNQPEKKCEGAMYNYVAVHLTVLKRGGQIGKWYMSFTLPSIHRSKCTEIVLRQTDNS